MLNERARAAFRAALGDDRYFDDDATRALYASDETPKSVLPMRFCFPLRTTTWSRWSGSRTRTPSR